MSDKTTDDHRMPGPPPEHIAVYQRIRSVFGDPSLRSRDARRRTRAARDASSVPYGRGRDPHGIGDVLGAMTSELGWDSPIAQAELLAKWPEIVGDNIASHTQPVGFSDGQLLVRCDSTPWATELRRMRATLTTKLMAMFPAAGLESVTIINPDAPSWKRGPRAIPGRGPRDTYG